MGIKRILSTVVIFMFIMASILALSTALGARAGYARTAERPRHRFDGAMNTLIVHADGVPSTLHTSPDSLDAPSAVCQLFGFGAANNLTMGTSPDSVAV